MDERGSVTAQALKGIERRMRLVLGCRDAVAVDVRKSEYKDLERQGVDAERLATIAMATMVHVMNGELRGDGKWCSHESVRDFLLSLPAAFHVGLNNVDAVKHFVVVTMLQNEGRVREHDVYLPDAARFEREVSGLIVSSKDGLRLTSLGLDVLFRSYEYEEKYGFDVRREIIELSVVRKNYGLARDAAERLQAEAVKALVKAEMFQNRCRSQFSDVNTGEYEEYLAAAEDAQGALSKLDDVQGTVDRECAELLDAALVGVEDETIRSQRALLEETQCFLARACKTLRELFVLTSSFSEEYDQLAFASMLAEAGGRLDFKKTFMKPAETFSASAYLDLFDKVMERLAPPDIGRLPRIADLFSLLDASLRENELPPGEEDVFDEVVSEDDELERTAEATAAAVGAFFDWLIPRGSGRVSEFFGSDDVRRTNGTVAATRLARLWQCAPISMDTEVPDGIGTTEISILLAAAKGRLPARSSLVADRCEGRAVLVEQEGEHMRRHCIDDVIFEVRAHVG